jgi:hypothetical protein
MWRIVFMPAILALVLITPSSSLAAGGPGVGTGSTYGITNTTAVVAGAVNANGEATTYAFQYGTTTAYAGQTSVGSEGPSVSYQTVTATLTELLPGTTYHFRLIAVNASGSAAGKDVTFKTGGLAPPFGAAPIAVTGVPTAVGAHDAVLTGTINPSGSNVRYYFQLGTRQPYELRTFSQTLPAGRTATVEAPISGLQDGQVFHYRLVAVNQSGEVSAGSDRSFVTGLSGRFKSSALAVSVSPSAQRKLPDTVTVSGRLVPPASLPRAVACRGFVDATFTVHTVDLEFLRTGIHADCTFRLRVRFANRHRLLGGHVNVQVVFPGNEVLHRLAAPTKTIQVG